MPPETIEEYRYFNCCMRLHQLSTLVVLTLRGSDIIRISGLGASSDAGNTHFYAASVDASFVSDPNGVALDPTGVMALGGDFKHWGTFSGLVFRRLPWSISV